MTYSNSAQSDQLLIDYLRPDDTGPMRFLFITEDQRSPVVNLQSRNYAHHVSNCEAAKNYLYSLDPSELPDLLVLDLPLRIKDLNTFRIWLRENFIPPIPVVYNEAALKPDEVKKLFSLHLIEDVIRNSWDMNLLRDKARFFKSLSYQTLYPHLNKVTADTRSPRPGKFIKRAIDICFSLFLITLLLPVYLLIALVIKCSSKGPVIYKSKRAGEGFRVFDFYKFRTMMVDADSMVEQLRKQNIYASANGEPAFFKLSNDPRVTRVGAFLRNTSLDELPQLFNVLKGDMSLVGNRPLPLYEAASLTTSEWAERFMAPAGITGLWQISKRGKPDMSSEERISLDITYARSRSIKKDLIIMLNTPTALFQKQSQ